MILKQLQIATLLPLKLQDFTKYEQQNLRKRQFQKGQKEYEFHYIAFCFTSHQGY
jgi:hypothetical protein